MVHSPESKKKNAHNGQSFENCFLVLTPDTSQIRISFWSGSLNKYHCAKTLNSCWDCVRLISPVVQCQKLSSFLNKEHFDENQLNQEYCCCYQYHWAKCARTLRWNNVFSFHGNVYRFIQEKKLILLFKKKLDLISTQEYLFATHVKSTRYSRRNVMSQFFKGMMIKYASRIPPILWPIIISKKPAMFMKETHDLLYWYVG